MRRPIRSGAGHHLNKHGHECRMQNGDYPCSTAPPPRFVAGSGEGEGAGQRQVWPAILASRGCRPSNGIQSAFFFTLGGGALQSISMYYEVLRNLHERLSNNEAPDRCPLSSVQFLQVRKWLLLTNMSEDRHAAARLSWPGATGGCMMLSPGDVRLDMRHGSAPT